MNLGSYPAWGLTPIWLDARLGSDPVRGLTPSAFALAQRKSHQHRRPSLEQQVERKQQSEYPHTIAGPIDGNEYSGGQGDDSGQRQPFPSGLRAMVEPYP